MEYEDTRLSIAENGLVLNYCEVDSYENEEGTKMKDREYKTKVFKFSEAKLAVAEMIRMAKSKLPSAASKVERAFSELSTE